ncbi:YggT family protein [Bisgaardia hudsonensis]|uniref:YggT family protein n=1 Tax=Bisgaardia hudsonensis TaxID=109472 RepID=A0A4R2N255_9PAST|nr:YggT family protein [Bisgaardia hudsonensis]QLB12409.1 hypothetical protein A6A11_01670 [Bisgaardia hudsonensis]TCP13936.1 YggT family protein [Bisgaardia hudsonensis]
MTQYNSIQYLVNLAIDILSFIFILRMWFQYCRVDFYNPLSQSIAKITNPIINPLQKVIPTVMRINFSAILVVFIIGIVKLPLISFGQIELPLLLYVVVGLLHTLRVFGEAMLYIIFFGAISSWFNQGANPVQYLLYQLGEPLLNPIRRILPKTGMIDFSPMLLAFILFYGNRVLYDILGTLWALA